MRSPEVNALCQQYQWRYLESAPGRGGQLDKGARSTDAPVLWFLHADAVPPLDGLNGALVKRLKARGKFRALDLAIGVSPRRWERDGWCRRTLQNRRMALAYMRGVSAERLAAGYH